MMPDLASRAVDARELMDDPHADGRMLERTYARFALVNAAVSGWRGVYRRDIRPLARRKGILRVLDVGAGGGDLARALQRRLRADGCVARVTGLDLDERAIRWAAAQDGSHEVRWLCASTADLARDGEEFDVVLSNHLLHHLTGRELRRLLADSRLLTAPDGLIIHSDIARGRTAYALFAAATLPLAGTLLAGSFIRADGLTSIRRSYTARELREAAGDGWQVEQRMPARLLLRRQEGDVRP